MEQITKTNDGLLIRAPAKINLTLLVAGIRPDGFHELETIMTRIDLYDELLFEPKATPGIELICKGAYELSPGKDNLVYRACEMFYDKAGIEPAVKITLTKNIPIGAGLGGGSSDAAAVLTALNNFTKAELKDAELIKMAEFLGSDVPFFLGPPQAFCTGRGENIEKIEDFFNFNAVLILPDVNVSTKRVYANYRHQSSLFEQLSTQINKHIKEKNIDLTAPMCANMLAISCFDLYPDLAGLKSRIEAAVEKPVCLSGSGSAMFCLFTGADDRMMNEFQLMLEDSVDCRCLIVNSNRW